MNFEEYWTAKMEQFKTERRESRDVDWKAVCQEAWDTGRETGFGEGVIQAEDAFSGRI